MNADKSHNSSQLAILIQDKLRLLEALLEKGNQQQELIAKRDSEELLHLLAQKQKLIEELVQVQAAMDRLGPCEHPDRRWNSPSERERSQQLAARCNEVGRRVLEIEAACEHYATAQRDSIAQQIQEFSAFDSRNCELNELTSKTHLAGFDESS